MSRPSLLITVQSCSMTAMTLAPPSVLKNSAAYEPTLPKPCTTTRLPVMSSVRPQRSCTFCAYP